MTGARWLVALALALALCAACKQQADSPPPPPVASLPAIEVKRAQDACKAYVDKVCGCARTTPALDQPCRLARSLPDAVQVGLDVGASTDSTQRDVRQVQDSVRKIAKECIEQLARLPAAACT